MNVIYEWISTLGLLVCTFASGYFCALIMHTENSTLTKKLIRLIEGDDKDDGNQNNK